MRLNRRHNFENLLRMPGRTAVPPLSALLSLLRTYQVDILLSIFEARTHDEV